MAQPSSPPPQVRYVPAAPRKVNPLRRAGCIIGLIIWFGILLIPAFFLALASNNEIRITLSDVPEHYARVWLISEARERGLGISTASVRQESETSLCVQTDLRFVLWQGSEAPSSYCECYERAAEGEPWSFVDAAQEACS